jgi:integrase
MRLMELLRLRVKDVDFTRGQIIVRGGKGGKDRVTMLPESLRVDLLAQLERGRAIWEYGNGKREVLPVGKFGDPNGNRTRASTVKGWCPNR